MSRYWSLLKSTTVSNVFKIEVDTTITAGSGSNEFKFPLSYVATSIVINWGDGNSDTISSLSASELLHTYAASGTYEVKVSGIFSISGNNTNSIDINKVTKLTAFGNCIINNFVFYNFKNIDLSTIKDIPTSVISLFDFISYSTIPYIDKLNNWDVSGINSMREVFSNATVFNQNLNNWDVSNVTTMQSMFSLASSFNGDISSWDVSNVTTMLTMFLGASSFNQDISNWDVSNVTNMQGMFLGTYYNFDLSLWQTDSLTEASQMFSQSTFNSDISNFNMSNVTNFGEMFYNNPVFNQDISSWDVSSATNMSAMFTYCYAFNQDISSWDFNINVNLSGFMGNKGYTNYNYQYYDNLLIKLASIMVGSGRTETKQLDMGTIKYSSAGLSARNSLVSDGWAITDGGSI